MDGRRWDQEADVVVIGSGGAGLTAAILAHDNGARVVVLERSDLIGGTTAVSGGGAWIPLNHKMQDLETSDSREEALTYCKRLTAGRAPDELVETFVDTGHRMIRYLEVNTPLRFRASTIPDYQSEMAGAKPGGRSLDPEMFHVAELGEWAEKLRPSPLMFVPLTMDEALKSIGSPGSLQMTEIVGRMKAGLVGSGRALVGRLLKGCLDRGISILTGTRARQLVAEDGRVLGVRADREGGETRVGARGGVVLACGGFEWNQALWARFQPAAITHHCSPPDNEGDALIMAAELGADLGNMSEAWLYPGAIVPGEEHDGLPVSRWVMGERTLPHAILVNRRGERFVNEGSNYNDMSRALLVTDPNSLEARNMPSWCIMDNQYRQRYPILTVMPTDPDPEWLVSTESLDALAAKVGINPSGLTAAVSRFNGFARQEKDADFGRGESRYEHWMGDPNAPHPNLGTLEKPPFYALPIHLAAAGTKGGPRTDKNGRVLNVRGEVIGGLYAAGNAMAGVSGPGYYGGGGTIGLGMTWGYICGINAAAEAKIAS